MDNEVVEMTPEESEHYKFGFYECAVCGYHGLMTIQCMTDHMRLAHGAQV